MIELVLTANLNINVLESGCNPNQFSATHLSPRSHGDVGQLAHVCVLT